MKRREVIVLIVIATVLIVSGIFHYHGVIFSRIDSVIDRHPNLDIFDHEQETYPNPVVIEKTGTVDASRGDEHSTSTAHVPSMFPVAGYVVTGTSSPNALRVPIMIYHSVRPHVPESALQDAYDITPELLASEIEYLKKNNFSIIKFSDVIAAFDEGKALPQNPVILSFDDGWENQYVYAFPVLKKYGISGTFFIYTNPIGRNAHWMTWNQIIEMDKAGMEIGGHSRTHPYLTKIIDNALLDKEILQPKEIIEARLGHKIQTFAYPFGLYNARIVAAVKRAGYKAARNVFRGVWQDAPHRYELRGALATDYLRDFEKYLSAN